MAGSLCLDLKVSTTVKRDLEHLCRSTVPTICFTFLLYCVHEQNFQQERNAVQTIERNREVCWVIYKTEF